MITKNTDNYEILARFAYDSETNIARILQQGENAGDGEKLAVVILKSTPYYVDVLNPDCVSTFISHTYEGYQKRFGESFSYTAVGFFTDEPQFSRQMPWSPVFPETFKSMYGYEVIPGLLSLFVNCEGYEQFRHDYFCMANKLYVESYAKQISQWCEQHGCDLTGHCMLEDTLDTQMRGTAGVMPFYEYMQQPGIDWLCRRISNPITPKQASSVAAQLRSVSCSPRCTRCAVGMFVLTS